MIVHMVAATDVFRTKGWLSKTPEAFRKAVLERCRARKVKAGSAIYRIGDPPTGIFGVCTGNALVESAGTYHNPHFTLLVGPGAWVGLRAVVTDKRRNVGFTARRDVELMFLPAAAMDEIVEADPRSWRHFARLEVGDLNVTMSFCDDLLRRDHGERLIAVLLHYGGCRAATPRGVRQIEVDAGQHELAKAANVGRTTASAVLHGLEVAGEIELAYRHISILAPDALRARLADDAALSSKSQ
ncbi:MAG: Crp/Fnr family transcriptional regulator [Rhodospirillales bacterium]|nr:Crp/Fnr family transcriptional regulator [Rhodospirillales bacterium]